MPKKDYYYDPEAPLANSLVVAVSAFVINESGEFLMIERSDNGLWAIPGGAQDIGESTQDAVVREVREETGIDIEVEGIDGIYSDPRHVIEYDDGEVRQEFSIVFRAKRLSGEVTPSSESKQVRWISPKQLDSLNIHPSVRLRISHALQDNSAPYLS
jgi:ADP-ribose pyrophosphatase YjhB (NUDIX family)